MKFLDKTGLERLWGKIENIFNTQIEDAKTFIAVYGATSFSEIQTAINAKKTVLLDYGGTHRLQLTYVSAEQFNFAGFVDAGNTVFNAICKSTDEWTLESNAFASASTVVTAFWSGTQSEYDAITEKNTTTLYLITEE